MTTEELNAHVLETTKKPVVVPKQHISGFVCLLCLSSTPACTQNASGRASLQ